MGHGSDLRGFLAVIGALLLCTGVWGVVEERKVVGSSIVLNATFTGDPSEINWKVDGNKLVDMERRPKVDIHFYRLNGRANIDQSSGSLTINNLTKEDSGLYQAEALVNNVIQETDIQLIVFDCPSKPQIFNQSTKEEIKVTCKCSTPGVSYEWLDETRRLSNEQTYTTARTKEERTLTCVVHNDMCKSEASITIPYIPDTVGINVGAILGSIIVIILLIVAVGLLYHFRKRLGLEACFTSVLSFFSCNKGERPVDEKPDSKKNEVEAALLGDGSQKTEPVAVITDNMDDVAENTKDGNRMYVNQRECQQLETNTPSAP